ISERSNTSHKCDQRTGFFAGDMSTREVASVALLSQTAPRDTDALLILVTLKSRDEVALFILITRKPRDSAIDDGCA
ncbi:unnamed protein product, partial [Sphenostylis stenocarpa]